VSHALRAVGPTEKEARATVRFGLGRFTTEEAVDYVAKRRMEVVNRLRTGAAALKRQAAL
jgi:cysteine desulfurase